MQILGTKCVLKLCVNLFENFSLKRQFLHCRSTHFSNKFNNIRFKFDTGRNTLQYRDPVIWNFLNRLVKVTKNFNSYKQILKKHTRDIEGFSFSKEAALITAKKMILYTFKHFNFLYYMALVNLSFLHDCICIDFSPCIAFILLLISSCWLNLIVYSRPTSALWLPNSLNLLIK